MSQKDASIINFNERLVQRFIDRRRPPEELRDQLDLGFTLENQVLEIFEIRPAWMDENIKTSTPVAKAKYVKSRGVWKIYWQRASGNWESYEPQAEVKGLAEFLEIVEEDAYGCFWG